MPLVDVLLPALLVAQAALGALDTVVNHELIAHLADEPVARLELRLHAVREAVYAVMFAGLGWFDWHGAAAAAMVAFLAVETAVTVADELVENRTRVLPQNERVLHIFLTLNFGVIVAVLIPVLLQWRGYPTGLVLHDHGAPSWLLGVFAAASAGWAVRDLIAWHRLGTLARA